MTIFTYVILALVGLIKGIPQNLEIEVVRVRLFREASSFPPSFDGLNILQSAIETDMLNYQLTNIYLPTFQTEPQTLQETTNFERILGETATTWTKNNQGRYLPSWNPVEFSKD